MKHDKIEKHVGLMAILIALVVSVGGIIEIVPLLSARATTEPAPGIVPLEPIEVAGRDVYIREGCYNCHSQQVRQLAEEVMRYGPAALAGESVYDHPFQWGSKRTGPDLSRIGGRYSDEWHEIHLRNPRAVVPESNMPGYIWLATKEVDPAEMQSMMRALAFAGVPYSQEEIEEAAKTVAGKTQLQALIAYLQSRKSSEQLVKEASHD